MASAASLHPHFAEAAVRRKGLGEIMLAACRDMLRWQHGGNTHLGAVLLLTPVAAAGSARGSSMEGHVLRRELVRVVNSMTYRDTEALFRAVNLVRPGGLGRVAYLDVDREKTYRVIREERLTPVKSLMPYRQHDVVAHEYATGYSASYSGYRMLKSQLKEGKPLAEASVNTFLSILSEQIDTHMARLTNRAVARQASRMCREAVGAGGYSTPRGRRLLGELAKVFSSSPKLKPAASADMLAASFAFLLVEGWRP